MDNWLYYIIVAGFFAISQVIEKRRKQAKKDGQPMAPPQQTDTSRPNKNRRRNRPNKSPDSLDEVLAEMLGIPKQVKPVKQPPTKNPKSSSKPRPASQQRIPTTPPEPRAPIAESREKLKAQSQPVKQQDTSTYGSYDRPKSVGEERDTESTQRRPTQKRRVNLRQAVIYQTILERKYS